MWGIKFIFIVLASNLIICPFVVNCTHYVPVYLWETTQFSEIVPALTPLSEEDFRKIITDRSSTNDPVLVFTEETLSPEDFALRDSDGKPIFASISSLKDSAHITYWPVVTNPIKAVTLLGNKNIVKTSIKELVDNPSFNINNNDVLIIDLKDAMDGEDRLEMLKRHDKDITEIYRRYAKSNKNIITMLTSYRSSWVLSNELRSIRRTRDVENPIVKADDNQTTESTKKTYSNKDLLIYVNSTATLNFRGTSVSLETFGLTPENKIDEESLNATLTSETKPDIAITFNFKLGGGYWSLNNISIANTSGIPYSLWIKDVYAPLGFSYHCHAQTFFNMSHSNVNLTLPGFQLQVYVNQTEGTPQKFGPAYDCVGFTSAPIWSGLFVTFIMALIMTFGLTMMMDIKTMDRFDDPKGKTITISAAE